MRFDSEWLDEPPHPIRIDGTDDIPTPHEYLTWVVGVMDSLGVITPAGVLEVATITFGHVPQWVGAAIVEAARRAVGMDPETYAGDVNDTECYRLATQIHRLLLRFNLELQGTPELARELFWGAALIDSTDSVQMGLWSDLTKRQGIAVVPASEAAIPPGADEYGWLRSRAIAYLCEGEDRLVAAVRR